MDKTPYPENFREISNALMAIAEKNKLICFSFTFPIKTKKGYVIIVFSGTPDPQLENLFNVQITAEKFKKEL